MALGRGVIRGPEADAAAVARGHDDGHMVFAQRLGDGGGEALLQIAGHVRLAGEDEQVAAGLGDFGVLRPCGLRQKREKDQAQDPGE